MKFQFAAAIAILFTASAMAETTKLSAFEQFEQQKATILDDLKSDTVYREISHSDANLVRDTLNRMSERLNGVNDVTQMAKDQQAKLFNDQDLVNTILTMAENDSRTVCRRRGRLGSNFKVTTCETVAERRERQEADRLLIDRLSQGRKLESN